MPDEVQTLSEWIVGLLVVLAGLTIVIGFLAWNGTLQSTAETVHEGIKAVCEVREEALSELEKAAILNQAWFTSSEDREFLMKIYNAGSVRYCDVDKLQKLLGTDKSKPLDRLRHYPCEAYTCLTGG